MQIVDTHCDVLAKLHQWTIIDKDASFGHEPLLQVNEQKLRIGNVKVQFFAVFIHPDIADHLKWQYTLEQIDLFYRKVIEPNPSIIHIKKWRQIKVLKENEIGAVLTIEGADMIGNDMGKAHHLRRLGVLAVGLTWNRANQLADGILEPRGAGLTALGKKMIDFHGEHHILTDVSHLSDRAFDEVAERTSLLFASHSNTRTICSHPRNLTDAQAKKLFERQTLVQINFYPPFLTDEKRQATIDDIIRHLDHFCMIGGEDYLGFGSDFDGIDEVTEGIEDCSMYPYLIERLLHHFSKEQVEKFTSKNFYAFINREF